MTDEEFIEDRFWESHTAARNAARDILRLRMLITGIHNALTDDLENGVAWLNDLASREFAKNYPRLVVALNEAMKDPSMGEA